MYDGVVRKHPHISFFDGLIRVDHADDKCQLGLIYSTFTALYIYTGGLWKPHKTRKEYRANRQICTRHQPNQMLEVYCDVCHITGDGAEVSTFPQGLRKIHQTNRFHVKEIEDKKTP